MFQASANRQYISFIKPYTSLNYQCVGTEFQGDYNCRTVKFNIDGRTQSAIIVAASATPISVSIFTTGY